MASTPATTISTAPACHEPVHALAPEQPAEDGGEDHRRVDEGAGPVGRRDQAAFREEDVGRGREHAEHDQAGPGFRRRDGRVHQHRRERDQDADERKVDGDAERVLVGRHAPDRDGGEPAQHAGREPDQGRELEELRSRLQDQGDAREADQNRRQHPAVEREAEQQESQDRHEDGRAEVEQHRLGKREHADRVVVAEQRRHQCDAPHCHEPAMRGAHRARPVPDDPRHEDREAQHIAPEQHLEAGKALLRHLDAHAGKGEHQAGGSHERRAQEHPPASVNGARFGLSIAHCRARSGGFGASLMAHRPASGLNSRSYRHHLPSVWSIAEKCVT